MRRFVLTTAILTAFLLPAIVSADNQTRLKDKKILMIIAKGMFNESEFKEPKEILEREGAAVIIASCTSSEAIGDRGLKVTPHIHIRNINVKNFDAVVFIGVFGVSEYFNNPQAHKISKEALDQNKILAAICMAPRILANAGLLKGKKATSFPSASDDIKAKGALVTDKDVERDGNIITANGPGAASRFGKTIVLALIE
ncbi:MAG: DJ-1/PfpI family protein [Deltaproteobacteria bacterium]|nr:DJ-1/PfpI family protein [Deltaproteobacteria bacterium]